MDPDKAQANPKRESEAKVSHDGSPGPGEPDGGWSWTVLTGVAALAIALCSLPRSIQAGDAGEFATVMLSGGVPHPSGYPWMRILGVLARGLWALGCPPAIAAALPPALGGVAAWVLAHRTCVAIGRPELQNLHARVGAFIIVLIAVSPLAVIHVNDSEVWGPHLLFSALFIHTVVRFRSQQAARPLGLGIALGLAISHHLSAVWLLPLAVGAAIPELDRGSARRWALALLRNGALGLAGSLLGLLPFATLPIGRGGAWRWGDVRSLEGLIHHVTRGDYGTFSLSLHEEEVAALDTIARALTSLGEVFSAGLISSPLFGALLFAGATVSCAALAPSRGRKVALGWALSLLLCGLGFPAMHNIDPSSPFGAWILERFDLLTLLLMIVPLVLGLGWAIRALRRVAEAPKAEAPKAAVLLRVGGWAIAAALLLAQLGAMLERGRPASEAAVELAAIDLLETPDPQGPTIPSAGGEPVRAIVFGTDDHRSFPALYAQAVLGAGAHTLYVDAQLLAHPWYREQLRARVPTLPEVDRPLKLIGAIWSDPELASVPIYLANVFSEPAARLPKIPEGMLWRIPPPSDHPSFVAAQWSPEAITERHLAAYARYRISAADFAGLTHPRGHPWSADLWHAYVDKGRQLAATLLRTGHEHEAQQVLDALEARTAAP
ncbi:MAG: DUF2723 domain-containing protein [Enhygromyxa sp.]